MPNAHTSKDSDWSALFDKFEENMSSSTPENSLSALDWSCIFEKFEKEEKENMGAGTAEHSSTDENWSTLFEEFEAIYHGVSKRLLGLFCLTAKRFI